MRCRLSMCEAAALSTPPPEEPPQQEHAPSGLIRRFPAHEHLDQAFATMGSIMKGKGGKPKAFKEYSAGPESKPLSSRMLVTSMLVLVFCLLLNQIGLFVPVVIMARNCILSKQPAAIRPKYPVCSEQMLSDEMTIVVTVKDACSQVNAAGLTPRLRAAGALSAAQSWR